MPIYEYQCRACGSHVEALQKMSDEPLVTCEDCGADELHKLISKVAFRLKGTGWYETDFKNGSKEKSPDSESSTSAEKENSDSSSNKPSEGTESKSGAKEDKSSSSTNSEAKTTSASD